MTAREISESRTRLGVVLLRDCEMPELLRVKHCIDARTDPEKGRREIVTWIKRLRALFGYQFAPRYKDLYDKVRTSLVGFKHPSKYGDAIIRPVRKAQKEFIVSESDNIQRIIVSLALKATTQSTIVSKLSAYARNNRTKRALWEYDNLIQSLYLLNYIDSDAVGDQSAHSDQRCCSYSVPKRSFP